MAASTFKLNDQEYTKCLQDVDFAPVSYKEVAECLMKNGVKQMYHAMVNEEDILTLFTIPNLKIPVFLMLNPTRLTYISQ